MAGVKELHPRASGRSAAAADTTDLRTYLFGPAVVKIRHRQGVWELTPHGQALGDGMATARHALVGHTAPRSARAAASTPSRR